MTQTGNETAGTRRFTIARDFPAPREAVFAAWTDGDALVRWWGPKGMTLEVLTADIRTGGTFHYSMQADGQPKMWGRLVYREVTPPERIVLVNSFADAEGNVAPMPYLEGFPAELIYTVTFVEAAGRTTVAIDAAPLNPTAAEQAVFESLLPSMHGGFGNALDQLAAHLVAR